MIDKTKALVENVFNRLRPGLIHLIIGASGLGKTSLVCCQIPSYLFYTLMKQGDLKENDRFVIVNCDGSLFTERLKQICELHNVDYDLYRKYVIIKDVGDYREQHDFITKYLQALTSKYGYRIRYLCIDPLNHHLRMEFAKADEKYRLNIVGRLSPQLESQMNEIHMLTRTHETITMITLLPKKQYLDEMPSTWQRGYFGPLEIAHLSDYVIWLRPVSHTRDQVVAEVLKNRLGKAGSHYMLRLSEVGLEVIT